MMADQQAQQRQQQPTSYPSPSAHSYPSPSMQPTYAYPPQGQAPHEQQQYRGSPQGSATHLPPLNLPPIRLQDGQSQPSQQQQQQGQQQMGSPLPPPQHGLPQYYSHPSHAPQSQQMGMSSAQHLAMRYQLPPQGEQRILSGGRHKKEIKRRTKTGCLTCRKRRIKCDEAHPICRNCQKSKRECLGYDPIFKQQPGPAQIQPAPNSVPHQASVPTPTPPASTPYGGQVPQGYAPAGSTGYPPPPSSTGGHPGHDNYSNSAIDPALAAADPAMHGGHAVYNGAHAINPSLRAGMESASSYPYAPPNGQPIKGKRLQISDCFPIGNHHPPDIPQRVTPITPELDDEFAKIFASDYCSGLDAILETTWFSTNNNGLNTIRADRSLREEAIYFLETVKEKANSADMAGIFSQEARLIWHILGACKHTIPTTNGANGTAPTHTEIEDLALREVRARFDILEALLTNQTLTANPTRLIPYPLDLESGKKGEVDFWHELGNFVVHADNESSPPGAADYALATMRNVLQAYEVRDAIYSIAVGRLNGNRFPGFPDHLPAPQDQNPETDLNKLHVAMGFISYECRSGSQQVTARICDMAMLSWRVSRAP